MNHRSFRSRVAVMAALVSCGNPSAEDTNPTAGWTPEAYCPGGPGCADVPGAKLEAGVAVRSVVPDCFESWEDFNADGTYSAGTETFLD